MDAMERMPAGRNIGLLAALVLAVSGCTVTYSATEEEPEQPVAEKQGPPPMISTPGIQLLGVTEQERMDAEATASRVLDAIDAGRIDDFWNGCTADFKSVYTRDAWARKVGEMRQMIPDGFHRHRAILMFHSNTSNDSVVSTGRYASIQNFLSCGEASCKEQLTLSEVDGTWQIAGYSVRSDQPKR